MNAATTLKDVPVSNQVIKADPHTEIRTWGAGPGLSQGRTWAGGSENHRSRSPSSLLYMSPKGNKGFWYSENVAIKSGILYLGIGCKCNDNQGYAPSCFMKSGFTFKIEVLCLQLPLPVHLSQLPSAATQGITFVY